MMKACMMLLPIFLTFSLSSCEWWYWHGDYCYTVTFNSWGAEIPATPSIKLVTPPARTIDALPDPPQKAGSTFLGWWTQSGGSGQSFTAETLVWQSITVYAVLVPTYRIGEPGPAGGCIFHDNASYNEGWRYLEAAPVDQSSGIQWWNGVVVPISTSSDIGAGSANTAAIVAAQGPGIYAAELCWDLVLGGYDDWHLPSSMEAMEMYVNLFLEGVGNFSATGYWTSTIAPGFEGYAGVSRFDLGGTKQTPTSTFCSVRAVRAF